MNNMHKTHDLPINNNTQKRKDEQRPADVSDWVYVLVMHIKNNISLLLRQLIQGIPDSCKT